MHLSSDFIIGFPGETDAHFEETYSLRIKIWTWTIPTVLSIQNVQGTPASDLEDTTSEEVKKEASQ